MPTTMLTGALPGMLVKYGAGIVAVLAPRFSACAFRHYCLRGQCWIHRCSDLILQYISSHASYDAHEPLPHLQWVASYKLAT